VFITARRRCLRNGPEIQQEIPAGVPHDGIQWWSAPTSIARTRRRSLIATTSGPGTDSVQLVPEYRQRRLRAFGQVTYAIRTSLRVLLLRSNTGRPSTAPSSKPLIRLLTPHPPPSPARAPVIPAGQSQRIADGRRRPALRHGQDLNDTRCCFSWSRRAINQRLDTAQPAQITFTVRDYQPPIRRQDSLVNESSAGELDLLFVRIHELPGRSTRVFPGREGPVFGIHLECREGASPGWSSDPACADATLPLRERVRSERGVPELPVPRPRGSRTPPQTPSRMRSGWLSGVSCTALDGPRKYQHTLECPDAHWRCAAVLTRKFLLASRRIPSDSRSRIQPLP